jgi:hypothetical protein
MITQNTNAGIILDWNKGMKHACGDGDIDIWRQRKERLKIVQLMISKGAEEDPPTQFDWFDGLIWASLGNCMEIVLLMIGNSNEVYSENNWGNVMGYACWGGNIEIIELIISKGVSIESPYWWSRGLSNACYNGHVEIVKLIVNKVGLMALDWNEGMLRAIDGRQQKEHGLEHLIGN